MNYRIERILYQRNNDMKYKSILIILFLVSEVVLLAQNGTILNEKNMGNLKAGINKVSFKSKGMTLSGNLYLPDGFDKNKRYPTIIYSGPMTQVKEQTGDFYGKKIVKKGFIFLAFDHMGFGDSEGDARVYENPMNKHDNIKDGISYLRSFPFVNRDKFYGLGVCASGGIMPMVALTDKRMKVIATVSGYMLGTSMFTGGESKEAIIDRYNQANEARQTYYETGNIEYVDIMQMETRDTSGFDKTSVFVECVDFYLTDRGGKETYPNYSHKCPTFSNDTFPLAMVAIDLAPYLFTPYIGIYGEIADSGPLTKSFYEKCSEPKEIFEIKGASHIDLYDQDQYVDQAVNKMIEFFNKY